MIEKPQPRNEQSLSPGQRNIVDRKIDDKPYLYALDRVQENLKRFSGPDIQQLREALVQAGCNDDEQAAVDKALNALSAIRTLQDKVSVLKRNAKNLEELVLARQVLERLPAGAVNEHLGYAARYLADAVYSIASPEQQTAAGKALGVMDEDEVARLRARVKNVKIS